MSSGFRATIIGCIAAISYVGAAQAGVIRHDTVTAAGDPRRGGSVA